MAANNLVAESDLRAVLQGIENKLLESCKDDDKLQPIFQKASKSLQQNLNNIVEAIPDDEYGVCTRTTNPHVDDGDDDEEEDDEMEDEMAEESSVEFDDDELLDSDALERARVLRQQVRDAAARVAANREATIALAVSLAQRKAHAIVGDSSDMPPFDAKAFQARLDEATTAPDNELSQTLQGLADALQELELQIPQKMETLQTTVETIQDALLVKHVSQTEHAIVSRDNEGPEAATNIDLGDMNGEQVLAGFLGRF
jgi:hypothetical protein